MSEIPRVPDEASGESIKKEAEKKPFTPESFRKWLEKNGATVHAYYDSAKK